MLVAYPTASRAEDAAATFKVGGYVTGLAAEEIVLQNNGGDDLPVRSNGQFTFATALPSGASYSVTVKAQPTSQRCGVTRGAATITGSNVTNVLVTCGNRYSVGGTVSGLRAGASLVLQNNGGDDLSIASDGPFSFPTPLSTGSRYSVAVKVQPSNQACAVLNDSGTIASAGIADITVRCGRAWKAIAAGDNHTVAITSTGGLWTWGWNEWSQLGIGTGAGRFVPALVGSDFTSFVAASRYNTVAMKTDGTLWAWGWTVPGKIMSHQPSPIPVAGAGSGFTSVGTRSAQIVAVKTDGTLWEWEGNGQSEDGGATQIAPVRIGSEFASVATNEGGYTLAVKIDGSLWAWGANGSGQLGLGDTTDRKVPTQVGSGFAFVAAAAAHAVAVKKDGTLWTWGANDRGQLGVGDTTSRLAPVPVPGIGSGFASVAAGASHTVAVKNDGTLWAWGANGAGQLGVGDRTDRRAPVQVGSGFASAAAGEFHTLAVKADGTLWTWGGNGYGQLGDGSSERRLTPVQIP